MPKSKPKSVLVQRAFEAIRREGDAATQRAFALIVDAAGRLGGDSRNDGLTRMVSAALRRHPNGAGLFQVAAAVGDADPELKGWLEAQLAAIRGDAPMKPELDVDFEQLAEKAAGQLAERGKQRGGSPAKNGESDEQEDRPEPQQGGSDRVEV